MVVLALASVSRVTLPFSSRTRVSWSWLSLVVGYGKQALRHAEANAFLIGEMHQTLDLGALQKPKEA